MNARKPNNGSQKNERGQAQIEFALSILTVLFLLFLCWELLMAIYTANVMADAAKEGVRYAIVHGSSAGSTCDNATTTNPCTADPFNVSGVVTGFARASLHNISGITISVTYPDGTNKVSNRVMVAVTYPYVPYVSFPFFNPTITTQAQGRIVY